MSGLIKIIVLLNIWFISSETIASSLITQTCDAMKTQLSYMDDIALYKQRHGSPIENLTKESTVLDMLKNKADELGVDSVSIEPFLKSQIFVAKAIQYRYRKEWLSNPDLLVAHQLKTDPPPSQLLNTGIVIITKIRDQLRYEGKITDSYYDLFMSRLQLEKLLKRDKMILFESLKNIKLKKV